MMKRTLQNNKLKKRERGSEIVTMNMNGGEKPGNGKSAIIGKDVKDVKKKRD